MTLLIMNKTLKLTALLTLLPCCLTISLSSQEQQPLSYKEIYANSNKWPLHVTPREDKFGPDGRKILTKGIQCTFVRAYPDAKIAIIDRSGTHLLEANETDFASIAQNNDNIAGLFLSQIARRVFSYEHSDTIAMAESAFVDFDYFLINELPEDTEDVTAALKRLDQLNSKFADNKIGVILMLPTTMKNEDFLNFLQEHQVGYPAIIPMFTEGFKASMFTTREKGIHALLIDKNNKIIEAAPSLEGITWDTFR